MNLEIFLILVNLGIVAISSLLPNLVYTYFVDTYVGIIVLLSIAFFSITQGYLVAVSTFTAVGALYAESHARKAKLADVTKTDVTKTNVTKTDVTNEITLEKQLSPAEKLVPNEEHPDIEVPPEEKVTFVPKEEDATDSFKPVGESINQKTDLPTTSFSKDAEEIYLKDNLAENSLRE